MEEIPGQKHHVDILLSCQAHDLVESLPAVIASDVVSLGVADMVVRGYEYAYGVRS